MNEILLGVIILLLIVCIILLFIILKKYKKRDRSKNIEVNSFSNEKIDISKMEFPIRIENMPEHILFQSCTRVFESFRSLDYASKSQKILTNFEWHSWQISLLLVLIRSDKAFFIPNPRALFHKVILDKSSQVIEEDMQKILAKYERSVNIRKTRDELSKDIIWSPREVSIIFYYMLGSNNF